MQLEFLLGNPHIFEIGERVFEKLARVQVLKLLGPTGAVLKLFRCVALKNQKPAWFQRAFLACPFAGALCW